MNSPFFVFTPGAGLFDGSLALPKSTPKTIGHIQRGRYPTDSPKAVRRGGAPGRFLSELAVLLLMGLGVKPHSLLDNGRY